MTTISVEGGRWGGGGGGGGAGGGGGEGGVGGAIGGGRGGKTALCTVTPKVDCARKPTAAALPPPSPPLPMLCSDECLAISFGDGGPSMGATRTVPRRGRRR
jgi:hypothetical protein